MENGNPRDASVLVILSILIVPVVIGYLCVLFKTWLDGDIVGINTNTYSYNDGYETDPSGKRTYINKHNGRKVETYPKRPKQVDRERPPNASFFCRVDGKETFIEGPYEEQFLTKYESLKWSYKKRRRELRKKVIKS